MSIQKYVNILCGELKVDSALAEKIIIKSQEGGEIEKDLSNINEWLNERLLPNCVHIDETGYSTMCINALKIVSKTAAELGHDLGKLEDYLPMDLHKITKAGEMPRPPKIKVGIKAGKWNGIWLDIPGDQFDHSDIHAFVKIGAGRDHLFAFFKQLSVFKDKVLKRGEEIGCLSKDDDYKDLSFSGKKGRINYTIRAWKGKISDGDLDRIKIAEGVSGKVSFLGIGEFSHDNGYLFNAGNLLWKEKDWKKVCDVL